MVLLYLRSLYLTVVWSAMYMILPCVTHGIFPYFKSSSVRPSRVVRLISGCCIGLQYWRPARKLVVSVILVPQLMHILAKAAVQNLSSKDCFHDKLCNKGHAHPQHRFNTIQQQYSMLLAT